jgi:hypothetical protein
MSKSACSVLVGIPVLGPGALDIDDHQWQLGHHRQAHRFRLERQPGSAGSGDADGAGERTADGRAAGRDLVLALQGSNIELLVP